MRKNSIIPKAGRTAVILLLIFGIVTITALENGGKSAPEYSGGNTVQNEAATVRHTQYVKYEKAVCPLKTDGFTEKLNNGTLSVWYNEKAEALRIVDIRSGYVWGCLDEDGKYGLNGKWSARAASMCYITYYDLKGKSESCALSDSTFKASFKWDKTWAQCSVSAKKLGISFSFKISIEGEKLTFAMEDSSLKETGKSKLAEISFMSFLGSVYETDVPGYVMIPDGSGALIRFRKARSYQSGYSRKIYGNDFAIDSDNTLNNLNGNRTDDYATDEYSLSLPLWGMVHGENQNGFFATVASGENYAVINAIPAGAENRSVKITRAYADFIYRSEYEKRVSSSKVVKTVQETPNKVNPVLTYTFLTGENANYSGMAVAYRQTLIDNKLIPEKAESYTENLSVLLNVIGSEVKKGFLSNGVSEMTDSNQVKDIVDELDDSGVSGISMLLSGWSKGGYHGGTYGKTGFEKRVGSKNDIADLRDYVTEKGGSFALTLNAVTATEDQIKVNRDAALNATLNTIVKTIPNKSLMYPDTYYMRHRKVINCLNGAFKDLNGYNLLLEGLGKYLYSDYTVKDEITRADVMAETIKTLENAERKILLDGHNLYLLKFASELANMPVSDSQYIYETDSIPFVQTVLHGSVKYYAPYSNQGFYSEASVLKMIEYGAYPSFMITYADSFAINDTPLSNYFSLNFDDWKEKIVSITKTVAAALEPVNGAAIVKHTAVLSGLYAVEYDNGKTVYINYNESECVTENGTAVPAVGYALEEKQ